MHAVHSSSFLPTFAIGDVHGQASLFLALLQACETRAAELGGGRVVLLGDYIDRGRESRAVIERIIAGPSLPNVEFIALMGNHDEMMLAAYDRPTGTNMANWMRSGGIETMISYGLQDEDGMFDGSWRETIPDDHIAFLRSRPDMYTDPLHIFVHAGLEPHVPLELQDADQVRWIREEFLDADHDFGRMVIHGHTIFSAPQPLRHRIGIDTGAHQNRVLTAVALTTGEPEFLQAVKGPRKEDPVELRAWLPQAALIPSGK